MLISLPICLVVCYCLLKNANAQYNGTILVGNTCLINRWCNLNYTIYYQVQLKMAFHMHINGDADRANNIILHCQAH